MIFSKGTYQSFIIVIAFVILSIPSASKAQNPVQLIWDEVDSIDVVTTENLKGEDMSRWSYSTSLGSSFGYSARTGSFMNLYLAPQLQYSATKRLMFHGGFIASHVTPLYNSVPAESNFMESYMGLSAFVAASYRLTDDLVIFGSGMKNVMNYGQPGINSNLAFDDISFGAAYSIGNFTIGASFHSGQSNRFNRSPFNSGPGFYPSPFYW